MIRMEILAQENGTRSATREEDVLRSSRLDRFKCQSGKIMLIPRKTLGPYFFRVTKMHYFGIQDVKIQDASISMSRK